jgi:hypothetical protein
MIIIMLCAPISPFEPAGRYLQNYEHCAFGGHPGVTLFNFLQYVKIGF